MKLITILGPTAVGKTKLAVAVAQQLKGEIISADSRQVYRKMDIGSGKDLTDFEVQGNRIPYHLIDIKDAGEVYDLYQFQRDFYKAYNSIVERKKYPILCGGTGMYLQAALAKTRLLKVPTNSLLRSELESLSSQELKHYLLDIKPNQHNSTDLRDRVRTIRAIEIEAFKLSQDSPEEQSPVREKMIFGIEEERAVLRERIKIRLEDRLQHGMIEEVEVLLNEGVTYRQLDYYGLEYRFIAQYLKGESNYKEMYVDLLQAIRRFAKKQMTWYRRMEKQGYEIIWLKADMKLEDKVAMICSHI